MNGKNVARGLRSIAASVAERESVPKRELLELVALMVYGEPTLSMKRAEAGRAGGRSKAAFAKLANPRLPAVCQDVASGWGVGGDLSEEAGKGEKSGSDLGSNLTGQDSTREPSNAVANATLLAATDHGNRADIERVFDFWRRHTDHLRAVLDRKRSARIASRLREGFTVERLCAAIANRRNDPFLMGANDTGRVFDGIETLLRDAAQVERLEKLTAPLVAHARAGFKSTGTLLMERSARIAAEEGEKIPAFPLFGGPR